MLSIEVWSTSNVELQNREPGVYVPTHADLLTRLSGWKPITTPPSRPIPAPVCCEHFLPCGSLFPVEPQHERSLATDGTVALVSRTGFVDENETSI